MIRPMASRRVTPAVVASVGWVIVVTTFAGDRAFAQTGPQLIVRVVDAGYLPLPGAAVEVIPVTACVRSGKPTGSKLAKKTDNSGSTAFAIPEDRAYKISTALEGFRTNRTCVTLGPATLSETAYVQVQLQVDPRIFVVH
jgi:hypothetical protein